MDSYEATRQRYLPHPIKVLFIAESPPPVAATPSSRQFYRTDTVYKDDRLFTNTIRALYPETIDVPETTLEEDKKEWLQRLKAEGYYMIEALPASLPHSTTKQERQALIREHLPWLLGRVQELAAPDTKLILIKSNVFEVAAEPLCQAGFTVLNTELVDYPGRYNQRAYRQKLAAILKIEAPKD